MTSELLKIFHNNNIPGLGDSMMLIQCCDSWFFCDSWSIFSVIVLFIIMIVELVVYYTGHTYFIQMSRAVVYILCIQSVTL